MTEQTPTIGHNQPSAHAALADQVEQLAAGANAWLSAVKDIENEEQAKKADDYLARVKATQKDVEAARKAEKKPHMDAATAVDESFKPLAAKLETVKKLFSPLLTRYLQEQDRKRREEQRRQEEEALRKMQEAEEAKRKAEAAAKAAEDGQAGDIVGTTMDAEAAAKAAEDAIKDAERLRKESVGVKGNYSERKTSLRTQWSAEIQNYDLALEHFKHHSKVKELIQSLADAAARSADKAPIPGVKFVNKQVAA